MKLKSLTPLVAMLGLLTTPVFAQTDTVRIAVANPGRIFNEMQETKDLKVSLESQLGGLKQAEEERKVEIQKLQDQRNSVKADTPQWEELNNKLMDAVLEFKLWGQQTQAKADRNQKRQFKVLFEHVEAAVAEVAKRDGYDLVLSEQRIDLPENLDQINLDQLRGLINSRNILYVAPKADISDAVIALLDSKHKGKAGAAAPAPAARKPAAPAPAPAPAPKPGNQ